ncbi:TrkA C-terminal domain-containing protein [Cellulosilyticum ruminicola]|uniref:TrkA C-terminal domain-containing protein n=1 Tax=Cellulosilyticum ruminicola TaxID=425254 RepID=UPI0006D16F98|nr:TrkA C-terminal domain-containing protein [Cellulosilyticum ruminicola]
MIRIAIKEGHSWVNKTIEKAGISTNSLAIMIRRKEENIVPNGDAIIKANDSIVLSVSEYDLKGEIKLKESYINKQHKWCGKCIEKLKLADDVLIALIKRGDENIISRGSTTILEDDIVVTYVSQ